MDKVAEPAIGPQTTLAVMQSVPRWLVWQAVPELGKKPRKVPFYTNGTRRSGTLDTDADRAQLATYDQAKGVLAGMGDDWGLAFALGPDGSGRHWQGVDFDDVQANGLGVLANAVPGYVEFSPSREGAHAIGYGRAFATLGSNASGIEAYAAGRFFTVTEHVIRDGALVDLAEYVEQALAPRHGAARTSQAGDTVETVPVDAKTVTELRSALAHMPSDDRDLWVRMGMALRELGPTGEGLWTEWSQKSEKYDAKDAARVWRSLNPADTGYQAVFAAAARQGWVNPASGAAQLGAPVPASGENAGDLLARLSVDWTGDDDDEVPDIVEGLVADEDVTLLGGHGGVGKSFLALQMACAVALGEPVLDCDTRQARVLYYSAEDGRKRLMRRLRRVTETFDYDPEGLRESLLVLDASEVDPLYGEELRDVGTAGRAHMMKHLGETAPFRNLQAMVDAFDPQLVIIDGASDTFDGNEIARREVRAFIKLLRQVHTKRRVGVMLLVHIDRASARGYSSNDDGYAGNAQWHNSCRRRMYLQQKVEKDDEDGSVISESFVLRVMKNTDGPPAPDRELARDNNGLWRPGVHIGGELAREAEPDPRLTVAALIRDAYDRGQFVTTSLSPNATTGVHGMLSGHPEWPRRLRKAKQTKDVVLGLERDGILGREPFAKPDRHTGERWFVLRDPNKPFERPAGSGGE